MVAYIRQIQDFIESFFFWDLDFIYRHKHWDIYKYQKYSCNLY